MRPVAWGLLKRCLRRPIPLNYIKTTRQLHVSSSTFAPPLPHTFAEKNDQSSVLSPFLYQASQIDTTEYSNEQFLRYLNSNGTAAQSGLPNDISKLDAYLFLRESDPSTLAQLNDDSLARLCMQIGLDRLGGVARVLLDDLEGKTNDEIYIDEGNNDVLLNIPLKLQNTSSLLKGGAFIAAPGSKRRMVALQNLLIGASRKRSKVTYTQDTVSSSDGIGSIESFLSSSFLERAFGMLFYDFNLLEKQQQQDDIKSESPIPKDLDERVIRRLIRTITVSKNAKLEPILSAIIKHIKRHATKGWPFPVPPEGCRLLEYYLNLGPEAVVDSLLHNPSSSTATEEMSPNMQAAHQIIQEMNAASPDIVSDALIYTANDDGQRYRDHLIRMAVPRKEAIDLSANLTIRIVIIKVMLKMDRYNSFKEQMGILVNDMIATANRYDYKDDLHIPAKHIRAAIHLALKSADGYLRAFDLSMRFLKIWLQVSKDQDYAVLLKALCDRAVEEGRADDASQILNKILRPMVPAMVPEADIIGAGTLTSICADLAARGKRHLLVSLLLRLGLMDDHGKIVDETIDSFFPLPIRANFLVAIAEAKLILHCRTLYERWASPLDYCIDAEIIQKHIRMLLAKPVSIVKPVVYATDRDASEETTVSVKQSSECLRRLVKLFATSKEKARNFTPVHSEVLQDGTMHLESSIVPADDVQFAYHVLFEYANSQPVSKRTREHHLSLASAYQILDQRGAAFKCLGDIVRREDRPTLKEAAELLRLLSNIDLEQTVLLVAERIPKWASGSQLELEWTKNKEILGQLYSPLLAQCLLRHRRDLAETLYESASDFGAEEDASMRAMKGFIKFGFETRLEGQTREEAASPKAPNQRRGSELIQLVKWIIRLMKEEAWRPDPLLLGWMIKNAVVIGQGQSPQSSENLGFGRYKFTTNNDERRAANLLLSASAKYLGTLTLPTVYKVLKCIQHKTYVVRQGRKVCSATLQGLSDELDEIVKVTRWVRHLQSDNSDQYLLDTKDITNLSISPTGEAAQQPNKFPAHLYRYLVLAYLRVGDAMGAANIMCMARDETKLSFQQLEEGWKYNGRSFRDLVKDTVYIKGSQKASEFSPRETMNLLSGTVAVPKSKSWWERPQYL